MMDDFDQDRPDGEIVKEIMEAGLVGSLGHYAGKKAARAAGRVANAGIAAVGANSAAGRIKGVARAANALTKIEKDLGAFMGSKQGFSRAPPTDADLLAFAKHVYHIDASHLLQQAKDNIGLGQAAQPVQSATASGEPQTTSEAQPKPDEQGAQQPGAATGNASVDNAQDGTTAKGSWAPPKVTSKPTIYSQQGKAAPAAASADAPVDAPDAAGRARKPNTIGPARTKDGRIVPDDQIDRTGFAQSHDSNHIDFDDPELQPTANPIRSSRQARDDERLGRNPAPLNRSRRIESLDFPMATFSEIISEKETQVTNAQTVPNKKQMKALTGEFCKLLARAASSSPQIYKHFQDYGRLGHDGHAYSGHDPYYGHHHHEGGYNYPFMQQPNRTSSDVIDRKYLNSILTQAFSIQNNPLAGYEKAARSLSPVELSGMMLKDFDHKTAAKILAALVITLNK